MDHSSRQSPEHEVSAQSERHLLLPLPAGRLSLWWWLVLAAAAAFVLARGVLSFFWLFALPLAYLFLGSAIAAALAPPITWLARWLPRAAAVILLYFFILATLFVIGWLIVPEAFEQIQEFIVEIPELVAPIQEWLNRNDQLDGTAILDTLTTTLTGLSSQLLLLLNLIAFFAGFTVGGIIGALVAVPLAAALRVFVMELVAPVLRRWTGVTS